MDKKKTILVVEDEEPVLTALVDKFSREGFLLSQAKDGEEGLALALKNHPDLILLDILMPKMDGIALLKKLREDKWGKNVPVFLLTNLSELEKISEAVKIGISGYLVKSDWKLEDIVKKVKAQVKME